MKLTAREREIMEVLWAAEGATNHEIVQYFEKKGKPLARQTTHTFLSRMMKKGLLVRENHKFYPLYTKEELMKVQVQNLLDKMYDSSLAEFFAALNHEKEKLTEDEIANLKKIIDTVE